MLFPFLPLIRFRLLPYFLSYIFFFLIYSLQTLIHSSCEMWLHWLKRCGGGSLFSHCS